MRTAENSDFPLEIAAAGPPPTGWAPTRRELAPPARLARYMRSLGEYAPVIPSSSAKMARKTEAQRRKEAKERAERALRKTKERLGLGQPGPLRGAAPSPLAAISKRRHAKLPSTSDRIPGSAPASDLLHGHKWKRGVEESDATTREMQRKSMRIAPAYNKGALQYLPKGVDRDEWPNREDHPSDAREPPQPRRKRRR